MRPTTEASLPPSQPAAGDKSQSPYPFMALEAAFCSAGVGIAMIGADGRFLRANPEFLRIVGYSEKELEGLNIRDLARPGESESEDEPVRKWVARTGETVQVRLARASLVEGEQMGWVATVEDVTGRLREYETMCAAAEHRSDAIFEWNMDTDRIRIYGADRIGLSKAEIPATFAHWRERIYLADLGPLEQAMARCRATREPATMRFRIARIDGSESLIELRGAALRSGPGEESAWVGVMSDITDKRRTEEALSQLAAIVSSSDDAMIGSDLDGRIVSWNKGAEALYGYTAAEIMGRPLVLLAPERPDEALAAGGNNAVCRMESVHFTKNGSSCPVSVTISPVRQKDGEISGFSLISRDIRERKLTERNLIHQARHDTLTGLPNWRLLRETLEQTISASAASGSSVGLFFIDIDGFKTINDTLGHAAGDQLLRIVAERLGACARKADMLSRVGGDEFVLMVSGLHNRHSARLVATKLVDCLHAPFMAAGTEVFLAASIGVSLFPEDAEDPDSLLRNADAAMHEAKRGGKNQVQFFSRALSDALRERMEIASSLRVALDRKEFELYFQPVFGTSDHRILRFEALLRWRPAGGAQVSPAKFIPVGEETGWIVPIGRWVLQEACKRAAAWQDGSHHGIGVSVNVSAVQLARPEFVGMLAQVLADTGLPPALLELELTESIFINNPRETVRTIARVHSLGVTMALDDFGTGYSSLGYLKDLPMDALKIDKSFLGGVGTEAAAGVLVESLISLAHSLGLRVVVEGVETRQQFEMMNALGCDELQGFLLGRPMADPCSHPLIYSGLGSASGAAEFTSVN